MNQTQFRVHMIITLNSNNIQKKEIKRMSQTDSSTFCNLNLEDSDFKKLQELDPFQTDGYVSQGKVTLPVNIVYTSQTGKQTVDLQRLTLQILTRWVKVVPNYKAKDLTKNDSTLDSLRICITSEDDIFLSFVCNFTNSSFESMKTKNQLNLHFKDFPNSILSILKNCNPQNNVKCENKAEFRLSYEGTGKFYIYQETEYKQIELLELFFTTTNIEKAHQSIIYRYNFNKAKLNMIENSINSIYEVLAAKNPPLLAYIQKTVGIDQ